MTIIANTHIRDDVKRSEVKHLGEKIKLCLECLVQRLLVGEDMALLCRKRVMRMRYVKALFIQAFLSPV